MLWASTVPAAPAALADRDAAPATGGGFVIYFPLLVRNATSLGPTPTPAPLSFVLSGLVYDASVGAGRPIVGADVSISVCQTRAFHVVSNSEGRYTLSIPIDELNACSQVALSAAALSYIPQYSLIAVTDLLAEPQHDFALTPMSNPQPTPIPGPW